LCKADVTLTIKCDLGVFIDGGNRIWTKQPQPYQFPHWSGIHTINVQGMGDILFLDLGDRKLEKYTHEKIEWTKKTWGGLIRYRGLDAYFRYEGTGHVNVVIDEQGSVHLKFDQGGMMVNVDDQTVG
jgi:hypothetical protein